MTDYERLLHDFCLGLYILSFTTMGFTQKEQITKTSNPTDSHTVDGNKKLKMTYYIQGINKK